MPDEEKHFVLIAEDDPDDRFLLEQGILNSDFKFRVTSVHLRNAPVLKP